MEVNLQLGHFIFTAPAAIALSSSSVSKLFHWVCGIVGREQNFWGANVTVISKVGLARGVGHMAQTRVTASFPFFQKIVAHPPL